MDDEYLHDWQLSKLTRALSRSMVRRPLEVLDYYLWAVMGKDIVTGFDSDRLPFL